MHPQSATMHFSLVLKQQADRVLLPVEFVFTLWSEEVPVAAPSPGPQFITKPLVSDTLSSSACFFVIVEDVELQIVNEVTFRSLVAAVNKCKFPIQGCMTVAGCVEAVCLDQM